MSAFTATPSYTWRKAHIGGELVAEFAEDCFELAGERRLEIGRVAAGEGERKLPGVEHQSLERKCRSEDRKVGFKLARSACRS